MNIYQLQWKSEERDEIKKYIENPILYFRKKSFSMRKKQLLKNKYSNVQIKNDVFMFQNKYKIVFMDEIESFLKKFIYENQINNASDLFITIKRVFILGISQKACTKYFLKPNILVCPTKHEIVFVVKDNTLIFNDKKYNLEPPILYSLQSEILKLGIKPDKIYFDNFSSFTKEIKEYTFFDDINLQEFEGVDIIKQLPEPPKPVVIHVGEYDPNLNGIYLGNYNSAKQLQKEGGWSFKSPNKKLNDLFRSYKNGNNTLYFSYHGLGSKLIDFFRKDFQINDSLKFYLFLVKKMKYIKLPKLDKTIISMDSDITIGNISGAIYTYQHEKNKYFFVPYKCDVLSENPNVCYNAINNMEDRPRYKKKNQLFFLYSYIENLEEIKKNIYL